MRIHGMPLVLAIAVASALPMAVAAEDKLPPFQFPNLSGMLPFIPLAPQPAAVPLDSEGWRSVINEYGPPAKGRQTQIVVDAVAELSRGAGYIAPKGGYRGTLLDTSILNAIAIGDGNIFVTRQLLSMLNNEDELIGVLGHEAGHVIGGHSRFSSATRAAQNVGDQLFGVFLPPVRGVAQFGSSVAVRGFDRAEEHAADVAGVKFLADLGRDPNAMGRALDILEAESKLREKMFGARPPSTLDYWLSDHPVNSERQRLVQLAANMAPRGRPGQRRSAAAFVRELDGLVFDDGPDQGIVDGGKFRHPVLKFALDAPPPFRLLNGSSALLLRAPGASSATLKMINGGGGSASERFKAAWARSFPEEIAPPLPEPTQIGGMPSAVGHVEKRVNDGSVRISMWLYAWSDTQSFIYAAIDPKAGNASQHAAAAQSFRRLSTDEANAVKVRRISVVEISGGDTIASLSQRMAYGDYREERFRLINGLYNGEPLPKSGPVKVVVWSAP